MRMILLMCWGRTPAYSFQTKPQWTHWKWWTTSTHSTNQSNLAYAVNVFQFSFCSLRFRLIVFPWFLLFLMCQEDDDSFGEEDLLPYSAPAYFKYCGGPVVCVDTTKRKILISTRRISRCGRDVLKYESDAIVS